MIDDSLEPARLEGELAGLDWVRRLVVLESTSSTNDSARQLARREAPAGTVVVAGRQRAGRGRMGRSWFSPRGLGLYVSVLFRPAATVEHALRWTLGSAVAACDAVRGLAEVEAEVKWPNDLLAGGLKLAGTLVELRSAGDEVRELVVGTGFNVHHRREDFPPELRDSASSLAIQCGGAAPSRRELLGAYLRELGRRAAQLEGGGWQGLRGDWEARAPIADGAAVRVVLDEEQPPLEGRTEGVDDLGALLVRSPDGRIVAVRLHRRLERI